MTGRSLTSVILLGLAAPVMAAPKGAGVARLTVDARSSNGPLDLGAITGPIRRDAAGLIACFDHKLDGPAIHDGALAVSLTIEPGGHARAVTDGHGPWAGDADFTGCVEARLARVAFPAAKSGSDVVVRLGFRPTRRTEDTRAQRLQDEAAAMAALLEGTDGVDGEARADHPGARPGADLAGQVTTGGTPPPGGGGAGATGKVTGGAGATAPARAGGGGLVALQVPTPRVAFERVEASGGLRLGEAQRRMATPAKRVAGCFRDAGPVRRLAVEIRGGDSPPVTTVTGLVDEEQACASRVIGRNVGALPADAVIRATLVIRPTSPTR
jgi:hypothetical protein